MYQNPIHEAIFDKVVKPTIDKISREADGIVTRVDYMAQLVDVRWRDHKLGVNRAKNVPIPIDGNGVFTQSLRVGSRVKLGFVHGDSKMPYISIIYASVSHRDRYYSGGGASMMKGLNYIIGGD